MSADTRSRHGTGIDAVARAERTALGWIDTVAESVGTGDRAYAFRVLRAWLHAVRDRLEVDGTAHIGGQLPILLRGIWYDGWRPAVVPVKFGPEQLVTMVADDAGVAPDEARRVIPLVTAALDRRWAPGQTEHLLTQLPTSVRGLVAPGHRTSVAPARSGPTTLPVPAATSSPPSSSTGSTERVAALEHTLAGVVDALSALVQALENASLGTADAQVPQAYRVLTAPTTEPGTAVPRTVADAAHHARRILTSLEDSSSSGPARDGTAGQPGT
ncbi:hypothetical protein PSD17_14020 [Pseudonocardia sp. D17]|jgi:uncharacterized protein (DUF2267 family)|nr:hypothetical protein PSD17_14020 [Pseudonocardia sp. D17]